MFYCLMEVKSISKKCTDGFVKQLNVGKLNRRTSCVLKIFEGQIVKEVQCNK